MTVDTIQQFPVSKEYEKHPDITPEDIQKLRDWLKSQPHLPDKYITELDLFLTYHCCNRSSEVAKQVLDLHYTLRTVLTTFFSNRVYDTMTDHCLNTVLYAPLESRTIKGYTAVYLRLLDYDAKNFYFKECVRTFMMVYDLWQHEQGSWPGFVIMIDMAHSTLAHVGRVDVTTVRQTLYFLQEAMLIKLKEVHFLNAPSFMDKVMMLLKPFMKKALMDMIHIHQSGTDTLYQYLDKQILPKEIGGEYKNFNDIRDGVIARVRNNSQFFQEERLKRVEESKRPGEKPAAATMFGLEGSFKKLDID